MGKTDRLVQLLRKHPDGMTRRQIAEIFHYQETSVGKLVYQTRRCHNIVSINHRYFLRDSGDKVPGSQSLNDHENSATGKINRPPERGKIGFRFLEILLKAGSKGVDSETLSRQLAIKKKTLVSHAHCIRKKRPDVKIWSQNRIFYASKDAAAIPPSSLRKQYHDRPCQKPKSNGFSIENYIDKDLLRGLDNVEPADLPEYLELIRKSTLYKLWGIVSVEVNKTIQSIEKEVRGESKNASDDE